MHLINFDNFHFDSLIVEEFQLFTSTLFHSVITAGKISNLLNLGFVILITSCCLDLIILVKLSERDLGDVPPEKI